ncbi:hypothetical protein NQ315_006562 [Exocentrus adspersus]|uniref:Helix-turn-helix domain-containing protein n=1 Tax=Exocentrus adspersus TaxID=1586481 RepID=A0AAV8VGS5_9CUCU|nr:hypothetical protein NQ315_006562 [Exocentrus adspersus]
MVKKMEDRYTLIAHYFACGLQQKEIIAMMDIVHNYKLHPRTLKRILRELMLYRRKRFSPITHVVNFISDQLDKSGQLHGYRWMHLKCIQHGLVVTQKRVRNILSTLDPEGTRNRRLPIGRPLLMFQAPTLFGVENRLIRIPERTIDCLENECTFYCEPCSDDIMQLCRNVISENNLLLNETITNPYDAVRLYIEIRTIIYQRGNHVLFKDKVSAEKQLSPFNWMHADNNLKDRTKLNVSAFMELLTLCIKTTYFQLENDFYQQDFGMAMGSSLSPIMSNIFMEHFEETYVKSYINKPKIWWRYVDDVFSIWPHGQDNLTDFLNFLNNIEPTIKFTLELEENNKLPFLDVMISKNTEINSNFQTNVYRKKTNTNRYLNFNSNHHLSIKKGVIKSLYDRAKLVSSNVNFFNQEKDHIKNILKENAYPINLVDRAFLQIENPSHNNQQRQNPVANMTIPYIPGISEKTKKTW